MFQISCSENPAEEPGEHIQGDLEHTDFVQEDLVQEELETAEQEHDQLFHEELELELVVQPQHEIIAHDELVEALELEIFKRLELDYQELDQDKEEKFEEFPSPTQGENDTHKHKTHQQEELLLEGPVEVAHEELEKLEAVQEALGDDSANA